jgi:hypothetical protein
MFSLVDNGGNNVVIMSNRAYRSHAKTNLSVLKTNYKVLNVNIDIIEEIGGGSARCMLMEIF